MHLWCVQGECAPASFKALSKANSTVKRLLNAGVMHAVNKQLVSKYVNK
jgi:hypothetical protein